jgi:phosphopantothenoylcysteine decarboxylase/phosphopantothenate--cysteine ligase
LLIKQGAQVKVVMTNGAKNFIHPNSFTAITGDVACSDLFDESKVPMLHIHLSKWADIFLICPVSASTIGKLASGICDNLLTTICTATNAKMFLAPSMNKSMWKNSIVQENIRKLENHGYNFIHPTEGEQACGDFGYGRMQEPNKILEFISYTPLKGCKVLVTAGPTVEHIDPVRYISNKSSGKMGYAIASTFHYLGADVSLITGPTQIAKPTVNKIIDVVTAKEMYDAVLKEVYECDVFISVAAVADHRLANPSKSKIKKNNSTLSLDLEATDDILSTVSAKRGKLRCIVGFSAETNDVIENARKKLLEKKVDFIIANKIEKLGHPFYSDENTVSILDKFGKTLNFSKVRKQEIAYHLSKIVINYIL